MRKKIGARVAVATLSIWGAVDVAIFAANFLLDHADRVGAAVVLLGLTAGLFSMSLVLMAAFGAGEPPK